jgi:hypothetical protein
MTKEKISLLLFLLLSTSIFADFKDWDTTDKKLWYSYLTLQTIDTLQTYDLTQCQKTSNCNWIEGNALFGKRPKIENIIVGKLVSSSLAFYFLDKQVDHKRTRDLWIINGISFAVVLNNYEVGFRFNYAF